jgi:predicted membrane protein
VPVAAVLEPQRPAPEAFGLTTDRLARFEHGRDRLYVRLFWVVFVLSFCLSMFEVFPKSFPTDLFTIGSLFAFLFALLLFAFIEFAMSFLVAGIVTFGLVRILEAAWKRTQPDYGRFRSYERAVAQYKTEYATWLKTQRSWWDRVGPPASTAL